MNTTRTSLLILAVACWVMLPTIAAGIAFFSFSIQALVWTLAGIGVACVLFETPRDWILDRFQ
ncbi:MULTISPECIES: hypothetical protein [Stenotrophomonas maltophilia group]|jgi:hypothetical protein|uniref:hypothetical protein n=1 Tax=Stenotrophomonas maltophilia group TaxID=995085 RepID=UPI0015DEEBE9|nr:hypothetical protein [Stenotrophomonas maltophilia]MBA0273639.1 hypothetical protein [Stenotrophomonas maltophilia]UXL28784.1 hypothetical protein N0O74_20520 [Stenotrophomonas maltophilia]HDS1524607.1 hypothetical protein [Stenotrophomonas maltophilia]HDS1659448.1 hypothetical protein [Stenotrophomonas maltophilia]HDS1663960.1 hypothetical protein [Stenotrophomonas maltophilia]